MADVSWTLGTNDDGDVNVDRLVADQGDPWPLISPGATETVQLGWDVGSRSDYTTVRKYVRLGNRPGAASTTPGLDTTPFYRELHDDANLDLLVSLEPTGAALPSDVDGLWGVIVGGSDATNNVRTRYELELELFVLAELSDYGTRSAAEDAHEK